MVADDLRFFCRERLNLSVVSTFTYLTLLVFSMTFISASLQGRKTGRENWSIYDVIDFDQIGFSVFDP